ncbi:hypothetical protein [Flavobacterium sp.]|uniref:hypothetical protein n=1 Tax=Flavobacterium sp. TaxID=239 RepID=UPI0039E3A8D5
MAKNTDLLNFLLIAISLFLAFHLPFELFLFSYAILGPLHYLTEINWLKQKKYFIKHPGWIWLLVVPMTAVSLPILAKPFLNETWEDTFLFTILRFISDQYSVIILFSFIAAIGLITFRKAGQTILFLVLSLAAAWLIVTYIPAIYIFTGIFLPTLFHVYIFTLLFMIYGTLQSGSKAGVASIVFLLFVPLIIAGSNIVPGEYLISQFTRDTFDQTGMVTLNRNLVELLDSKRQTFSNLSPIGIKTQIFVAFAYTYHYLNWFSKTTVIGWHKNLTQAKTIAVISIWVIFMGLYLYDFKIGMIAAYFLSMGHIFLEFPLNMTSIKAIALKIKPGNA